MEFHRFRDREDAGRLLASRLKTLKGTKAFVLAIPNGGALVGASLAKELGLPLRLIVVRKIQFPDNPEAGFGAVGPEGSVVLDQALLGHHPLPASLIEQQKKKAQDSIRERLESFGTWAQVPDLKGIPVVVVDDGLATGSTMEAAISVLRRKAPARVIVAVPTSSHRAWKRISTIADELVCLHVSRLPVYAVADAYENWYDPTDQEVLNAIKDVEKGGSG